MGMQNHEVVVEMKNITKKFGSFTANDNITIDFRKGEVHALLGENGAGKSTLMNILYGLYKATKGSVTVNGDVIDISSPNDAIKHGIGMVHQHFMLIPVFTVTENIMLGNESVKNGFLNSAEAKNKLIKLSDQYKLAIDPDSLVSELTVGMQQRVEILKALYREADVLILDEPTAVLTPQEIDSLKEIIKNLTQEGKTVIIITHKLKEILAMADRCTVIRKGKKIGIVDVANTNESELASMMVGREVVFKVDKSEYEPKKSKFEINDLVITNSKGINVVDELCLKTYGSEILGIAGIDGNGQSELVEGLLGLRKINSGKILLNGKEVQDQTIRARNKGGFSLIPEDRHKHGLVLDFSVSENFILNRYNDPQFSDKCILKRNSINSFASSLVEKFDVRLDGLNSRVAVLSGGNQQKVIIAREVSNNPDVLVASQPTRGLDVGAIEFVHRALLEQRELGKTIILVSYELDEIMNIADRIAVIYEGKIVGEYLTSEVDEYELGLLMSGGTTNEKF
ncbi:MAG: ABC transporter ATP-binding protein [Vallitalea sp.]|jgi:simple sugar transport system ATP-binding protein|nr:ABC transporter ATP-binding protein [Vallitalea sp.]